MTAYEIVDYFNSLPQRGVVIIETSDYSFYFIVDRTEAEAVSDSILKLTGIIGYTLITLQESSMMLDTDKIDYIRHVPETHI